MLTYYAIARRFGQWVFVCSGTRPEDVYREAITLLEAQERSADDETIAYSPTVESQLDTLRVVPEETARDHYHVVFSRRVHVED